MFLRKFTYLSGNTKTNPYLCPLKKSDYGKRNQKSTALAGWPDEDRMGKASHAAS